MRLESRKRTAIRALGALGTPGALDVLREAAGSHPDAHVRRLARAEVRKLEGRGA